jgi:2-polyprenyl-6-methoxyphenol hydroxylase-like FAD-dependent oxidoreductase
MLAYHINMVMSSLQTVEAIKAAAPNPAKVTVIAPADVAHYCTTDKTLVDVREATPKGTVFTRFCISADGSAEIVCTKLWFKKASMRAADQIRWQTPQWALEVIK